MGTLVWPVTGVTTLVGLQVFQPAVALRASNPIINVLKREGKLISFWGIVQ
jgi:hypothetical protein